MNCHIPDAAAREYGYDRDELVGMKVTDMHPPEEEPALLDAIRRDTPAPTVHARNLFHTSAAIWDAWAAYDPVATGLFVTATASFLWRPTPCSAEIEPLNSAMTL